MLLIWSEKTWKLSKTQDIEIISAQTMSLRTKPTKQKSTTIEEIKGLRFQKSAQKIIENLTCAIVNKSDLRSTKNGKMFSVNLCDQSSKATMEQFASTKERFQISKNQNPTISVPSK